LKREPHCHTRRQHLPKPIGGPRCRGPARQGEDNEQPDDGETADETRLFPMMANEVGRALGDRTI
jgi:hypothetical protein